MIRRIELIELLLEHCNRRNSSSLPIATNALINTKPDRSNYSPNSIDRITSVSSLVESEERHVQETFRKDTLYTPKWKFDLKLSETNQFTKLAEVITPLCKVPYPKQLNVKFLKTVKFLQRVKHAMHEDCIDVIGIRSGLPCELLSTLPSPKWRGYRNIDEFVVHVGLDQFTPTVGFCLGNPNAIEKAVCVEPSRLTNIKPEHKAVAKLFQDYIQSSSLPVTRNLKKNFWRKLLVRSNHLNQLMVSATVYQHRLSQNELDKEKQLFCQFFTEGPGKELNIKSIFFQACQDESMTPPAHELLFGEKYLEEMQGGIQLRFSPLTSMLENSTVSETFFEAVVKYADLKPGTTLLDINCGAGGLGLYMSKRAAFARVIGVKLTPGSIWDNYEAASENDIHNATFTQRNTTITLRQLKRANASDLVAVINMMDTYVDRHFIFKLKGLKSLRRVIYVTRTLTGSTVKMINRFSCPNGWENSGPQFFPVQAIPVDIYPQTNEFYFIIVLERVK